jgi:hypothetical protein
VTQPFATLITGAMAVVAAVIAFCAVNRQINAAAEQQKKNREAEWARLRRGEMLDLLMEAARMSRQLAGLATNYEVRIENPNLFKQHDDEPLDQQLEKLKDDFYALEGHLLVDKLDLLGAEEVSHALKDVVEEASGVIHQMPEGEWTIYEKEEAVAAAIKAALKQPADQGKLG